MEVKWSIQKYIYIFIVIPEVLKDSSIFGSYLRPMIHELLFENYTYSILNL